MNPRTETRCPRRPALWACGLLAAAAAAAAADDAPDRPLLRVPRLARAPSLDGRIGAGEWDGAAALTGLVSYPLGGALAPPEQQATFFLGYDGAFLYLAMRSPNPPGRYPVGRTARSDGEEVYLDDHIEWQILTADRAQAQQPGHGFYKLAVNPLGTLVDQWLFSGRADRETLWSGGGGAACTVTPGAWELEASVSFESLGLGAPDGRTVAMHLVRAGPGGFFSAWAPGTWLEWDRFGDVTFDPAAPAVRLLSVGDPAGGALDVRLETRGGAPGEEAVASVRLENAEGGVLFEAARPAASARFEATGLALDDAGNVLAVEVRRGGEVLYRNRVRVDRLTGEQREAKVTAWIEGLPEEPPSAVQTTETVPGAYLAFVAATRKRMEPLQRALAAAARAGDMDAVGEVCRRMVRDAPFHPLSYYHLACYEALQAHRQRALDLLEQAVDRGFNNVRTLMSDPDLESLRASERFAALVAKASESKGLELPAKAAPAEVDGPVAWVADGNVMLHPQLRLPVALYRFPEGGAADRAVTTLKGPAGDLLRAWFAEGTAAGNWGDLYDNRDGDHSDLPAGLFPQLTRVEYSDHARDAGLHHGEAVTLLQDAVTIGNASLASTRGPYWRSLPRRMQGDPRALAIGYLQYRSGKIYIYPTHADFAPDTRGDPEAKGVRVGDAYFANTPYVVASRGSSGSDQAFLRAFAATLAAFPPETKRALQRRNLLMPALQMLLRRHYDGVATDEEYLTGKAHPPGFGGGKIGLEAMVRAAHGMTPDALPPWAEFKVIEEDRPVSGRDYFAVPGRTEEIFTTRAAAARILRGTARTRRVLLDGGASADANGLPLTYHWRLLQGDPALVTIEPRGERGEQAEITVAWHPPRPAASSPDLVTTRVDLALFVHNGRYYSPPAFLTFYCPGTEERTYDDAGRLLSVAYHGTAPDRAYADPMLYVPRRWKDVYDYDGEGRLTGWTRTAGDTVERFDAEGRRLETDGSATVMRYAGVPGGEGEPLQLRAVPARDGQAAGPPAPPVQ